MNRLSILLFGICVLLLLSGLGCANPAEDKPEAQVQEPVTAPAPVEGDRYVFAEGSSITWVGSKVTGSHDGGFNSFDGEIVLVNGDPTASSVSVVIDTKSIWSDNEKLTGHLMSPDFFEVETYPTATFSSTSIESAAEGYMMTGNLELHGVTKSISFPASITVGEGQVSTEAEFFIKRNDFGIIYPGKPDDLIRDEVVIKFSLVAVPAEEGA
jgi:polyisoprenoid-binding protein YceI